MPPYNAIAVANHALEAIEQLPDPGAASLQKGLPIAGVILTFIACYELIKMITQHNNMGSIPFRI